MSMNEASGSGAAEPTELQPIEQIIDAQPKDIDGIPAGRVLPSLARRMVGPFIFLDYIGPAEVPAGGGLDVRPHPHVNLATVTYLFDGEFLHRDSLGYEQTIRPGAVNWMTAGRGIVHSERTPESQRRTGFRMHGVQFWVALPNEYEEVEPSFRHFPAETFPSVSRDGAQLRVLAGEAYGVASPVPICSRLFLIDAELPLGSELELPNEVERAALVVEGSIRCGAERAERGRMLVFTPKSSPRLRAETKTRLVLLGGDPVGQRHIYWNFVSSTKERIEQAKRDWREGRFPKVPGDEHEFIPLPPDRSL